MEWHGVRTWSRLWPFFFFFFFFFLARNLARMEGVEMGKV